MADCIFCKIIAGDIPCDKVFEDDRVLAFNDIAPKAPVHVIVVPKVHIKDLIDSESRGEGGLMGHIMDVIARIARERGIAESGFRVINNCGPDGGQEVDHVHFHVLGGRRIGAPLA